MKFQLAEAALEYWSFSGEVIDEASEDDAWIEADCEDEARSATIEDGGCGMVSAFGCDGIDRR